MIEDEAKTKWCPFARTVQTDGKSSSMPRNRIANTDTMTVNGADLLGMQCLGSACMAWRWFQSGGYDPDLPRSFPTKSGYEIDKIRSGFCGIAGKP